MTVEVDQSGNRTRRGHAIAGSVVGALIGLVHTDNGEIGVAQALALAGDRRSFAALGDPEAWSTLPEAVALFNAAALVTEDGAVGFHVGESLMTPAHDAEFLERLRGLGSMEAAIKQIAPILERFDRSSDTSLLEVSADHALIQVEARDEGTRHAHLCEMTRGMLTRMPTLFDLGPALITESECSARGGHHCLYAVSWDVPDAADGVLPTTTEPRSLDRVRDRPVTEPSVPSGKGRRGERGVPDPATVELHAELHRMEALIDGAFATATEVLTDDVESLLAQIATCADAVVSARRYLLMVRIKPESPVQLHYRGISPERAQTLAASYWSALSEAHEGPEEIVDIVSSRRHYGRLVTLPADDDEQPPYETRVLERFADYGATALDLFGVVADAKRSDATARTLLRFSDKLSQVSDLDELVMLLADTVPEIIDCTQSTIYLWDADLGQLVPRARTAGLNPPDGNLDAIIPVDASGETPTALIESPFERLPAMASTNGHGPAAPGRVEPSDEQIDDDGEGARRVTVRTDEPVIDRMISKREVIVLDQATSDPFLRALLDQTGTTASVVAPLFAGGEFLGVIAANYLGDSPTSSIRDPDLHERLSGLADQAATALQNRSLLEKVSHMAWHDVLTGLPNRRLFEDRVEQELVRSRRVGEPVCMFFVDLDHFKEVNDTFGHAAGDQLIQQVAQRLVDTVRSQDTVARVGGDEFAILLPGLSDQGAIDQLARRSLEAVGASFEVSGRDVEASASIGIAMAPEHGDSYDELLSRADEAMYRAKDRGRNAFHMYSDAPSDTLDGTRFTDERTLYGDLLRAVERHEFFVLYQPYIDLHSSEMIGVETLVRWRHPVHGVLEPASFITLAEQSDVVVSLDAWVLEETCRQARRWMDHGYPPLRLSVNLASRDLSNDGLFASIEQALDDYDIDPSQLELEITERVVVDQSAVAKENIEQLRRLGVRFTIDDFGTGNSSLSRIGAFPVSTLKIDQSFVQVLGPDGEDNALVSAIISMADRLGLDCVAEGVETAGQRRVLLQRGCSTAQGYYFSPPLDGDEIELMMTDIAADDGTLVLDDGSD